MREAAQARNHRRPLEADDIAEQTFTFYIDNFEELIGKIVRGIHSICPDYLTLVNMWHIKDNSYYGSNQMQDENERGESYERDDHFNVVGLGVYVYLTTFKRSDLPKRGKPIRPRALFTRSYEFELYLPFIRHLIENPSETLS
jgi:hypothetical protein